jgi:Ca2+-binding EF-hand superfamily protein
LFNLDGELNIFEIYTQKEIEDFRTIFDIFDQDKSGYVNLEAIKTILSKVGREPDEAVELIH